MLARSYRMVRHFSKASDDSAVMLKRELVADVIQNALKVSAYMASGSHAVKAEIMRAALDAGNHVVMYFANYWARQSPDEFHNYGNSQLRLWQIQEPRSDAPRYLFRVLRYVQLDKSHIRLLLQHHRYERAHSQPYESLCTFYLDHPRFQFR